MLRPLHLSHLSSTGRRSVSTELYSPTMWSSLARVARIFSTWFESLHDLDYLDYLRLSVSCCFFHDKQISPGAYAAMLVSLRVRKLDANWNCTVELCTPTGWSKFDRCQPCHKSSRLHRAPCKSKRRQHEMCDDVRRAQPPSHRSRKNAPRSTCHNVPFFPRFCEDLLWKKPKPCDPSPRAAAVPEPGQS